MSYTVDDPLYTIFEEHLHSGVYDDAKVDKFIEDVVEFYLINLNQGGHIPLQMVDKLRQDLSVDVQDMLRVKTYGHTGIAAYNQARRRRF